MRGTLHVPARCGRCAPWALAAALAVAAAPARAEIEVVVREDGSRWVRNGTAASPAAERPSSGRAAGERPAAPDGAVPAALGAEGGEARARYRSALADAAAPPRQRTRVPVVTAEPGVASGAAATRKTPAGGIRFASASAATAAPTALAAPVDLDRVVAEQAEAHGLDPRLVHAVIRAESAGNRLAVSRVGAMGLMQLMPATAAELAVADPWDETENVRGGAAYLKRMLDRFERLDLALAAYNAGPSAVERHGAVPPYRETVDYVRRVLGTYHGRPVALSEIRVAPSYVPPASRAARRSGSSPVLVRDGSGRLHLTNAHPAR